MNHIRRITWKPIDWHPESPDQYPDGLPVPKPEHITLDLPGGTRLLIGGLQLGDAVLVRLVQPTTDGKWMVMDPPLVIPADSAVDVFDMFMELYRVVTGENPARHTQRLAHIEWKIRDDRPTRLDEESLASHKEYADGLAELLEWEGDFETAASIRNTNPADLPIVLGVPDLLLRWNRHSGDVDIIHYGSEDDEEETVFLTIPVAALPLVGEAVLYVHRRTHEHEYEGQDWTEDEKA